jgi:hypothetical protein
VHSAVGPRKFLNVKEVLERETGIEPATNSLEGCDSTIELLPPTRLASPVAGRYSGQPALFSLVERGAPAARLTYSLRRADEGPRSAQPAREARPP